MTVVCVRMGVDVRRLGRGHGQRGSTLVIALVILMLLMIHSLASFTAADAQLRNVGALQVRQEAQSAAQLAIAGALGSSGFVAASLASPFASSVTVDVDGDGNADYRVALSITCSGARAVTSIPIPPPSDDDAACLSGATVAGDIPCADTSWNIRATATAVSGALPAGISIEVNQGASIRLESSDALRSCPVSAAGLAVAAGPVVLSKARRKTYWYVRPGT